MRTFQNARSIRHRNVSYDYVLLLLSSFTCSARMSCSGICQAMNRELRVSRVRLHRLCAGCELEFFRGREG
ncbi:hypothetical protein BKA64DRAFT_388238 [Cadophora sp. MPI-SDFR-AT-0126]|nr:hypothetical protein BKA64DRAFT_388238 [Leotiomycetes sp. MPI-SDFR-AT-0126]